jgi:hypothetical protein
VTSFQSSVTGSVTLAPFDGLTRPGAAGVGGGAALTVSAAVRVVPSVPLIVDDVDDPTASVVTVNVRLVEPAETVTLDGTVAADVLLLDSATTLPPDGAAPDSVTVPVDDVPPDTLVGFSDSDERVGPLALPGSTVRPAD